MSKRIRQHNNDGGLWAGVAILCAGLYFLLKRMGLDLPDWVFSWEMLLILIGFLIGVKRKFQGVGWFVLMLVGGFFMIDDILPFEWHVGRFFWPILLCLAGIYIIGRSSSRKRRNEEYLRRYTDSVNAGYLNEDGTSNSEDFLQTTSIFGSNNRTILSKNFRGGNVTTIFGGTELNFMQADIQGEVILDISTVFGGVELVIPSNWELKMEVDTIFGGIEDKRMLNPSITPGKTLIIKGACIFGGVDIKSY